MIRRVTRALALLIGCVLAGMALGVVGRATVATSGRAFDRLEVDLSLVSPSDKATPRPQPATVTLASHEAPRAANVSETDSASPCGSCLGPDLPLLPPLPVYGFDTRSGDWCHSTRSPRSQLALFEKEAEPESGPTDATPPASEATLPNGPALPPLPGEAKTADATPPVAPERLPDLDRHAAPIEAKPEGQADDAVLRKVIERELPEATAQERQIWLDELRGLSPSAVRDLLQLRRMINKPGLEFRFPRPADLPPRLADRPVPLDPDECPVPELEAFHPLPPMPEGAALATVETSVSTLRDACSAIANNLANARTAGYKRLRIVLADLPYDRLADAEDEDVVAAGPPSIGLGVYVAATEVDLSQGELRPTGDPWEVAIDGPGWFSVKVGDATRFTRAGRFRRGDDGSLSLRLGGRLWPLEPAIAVPRDARSLEIGPDGVVKAARPGAATQEIGRIELSRIAEGVSLVPCGDGMYAAPEAAATFGPPGVDGLGELRSGRLESSNVHLRDELNELQELQTLWRALRLATPH